MPESAGARIRRQAVHFGSHPIAWGRYLWRHELRHREVLFQENPRFAFWEPTWRVSRHGLARVMGTTLAEIDAVFAELPPLHARLKSEAGALPSAGALMQAPLLYVLTRIARPRWIVETGISSGFSARIFLEALRRNGDGGRLDSIGIDTFGVAFDRLADPNAMRGKKIGWLVPPELADHWTLHVGTSQEKLPALLASRPEPLDLFLHDSLHKYPTMSWEYSTAWPRIPPGGYLASHDVHVNRAWPDFLGTQGLLGADAELDRDLGLVRRPPARG